MLVFNVVLPDAEAYLGAMDKLEAGIGRASEVALDKSAAMILNKLRQSFLAETTPSGQPWLPSKAAIRRRAKGGTGTLFKTGHLFRSIQLFSPAKGERTIGSDVGYGADHQYGLNNMTQRVFLDFTDAHRTLAEAIFINELNKVKV